jgi:4-amino-4-deoxy-L-arabinose transferase
LSAHGAVILAASEFKAYEAMTAAINQRDPERRLEVLVYQDFLPSISFYRNRLAVMALGRDRETLFQDDDAFRQTTLASDIALNTFLSDRAEIFVVAKANALRNFQSLYPSSCEELFRQRRQGAYLCRLTPQQSLPRPQTDTPPH